MKRTTAKKPQGEALSWKIVILAVSLGVLATVWGALLIPVGAQAGPGSQETQGNPQILIDVEELRVELNDRIDLMESNLSSQLSDLSIQMADFETKVSGGIAAHDTNIDGDLVNHDTNIDTDLVDHHLKIEDDLVNHDANIDFDLANSTELVRSTHLIDPFDMQVTACANISSDADFDHTTHFEQDFAYGPGLGIDAYGNGAQVDWMVQFDNGLYADVGAEVGLGMTACFNGIFIREDGTVEGASTSINELQTFLTDSFANQADLVALRTEMATLAQDLKKPLSVKTVKNSLVGLGNIDMNLMNPFQLQDNNLKELSKELPFTSINEAYWPDSPIEAMFIDLNPIGLICSDAVKGVFSSAPGDNPITTICASNFNDLIVPLETAFKTIIPEIDKVVEDIEDVVDDIEDIAVDIAGFFGIDI